MERDEELTNRGACVNCGAVKCYVDDVREEFARDYIFDDATNTICEGTYLLEPRLLVL